MTEKMYFHLAYGQEVAVTRIAPEQYQVFKGWDEFCDLYLKNEDVPLLAREIPVNEFVLSATVDLTNPKYVREISEQIDHYYRTVKPHCRRVARNSEAHGGVDLCTLIYGRKNEYDSYSFYVGHTLKLTVSSQWRYLRDASGNMETTREVAFTAYDTSLSTVNTAYFSGNDFVRLVGVDYNDVDKDEVLNALLDFLAKGVRPLTSEYFLPANLGVECQLVCSYVPGLNEISEIRKKNDRILYYVPSKE